MFIIQITQHFLFGMFPPCLMFDLHRFIRFHFLNIVNTLDDWLSLSLSWIKILQWIHQSNGKENQQTISKFSIVRHFIIVSTKIYFPKWEIRTNILFPNYSKLKGIWRSMVQYWTTIWHIEKKAFYIFFFLRYEARDVYTGNESYTEMKRTMI